MGVGAGRVSASAEVATARECVLRPMVRPVLRLMGTCSSSRIQLHLPDIPAQPCVKGIRRRPAWIRIFPIGRLKEGYAFCFLGKCIRVLTPEMTVGVRIEVPAVGVGTAAAAICPDRAVIGSAIGIRVGVEASAGKYVLEILADAADLLGLFCWTVSEVFELRHQVFAHLIEAIWTPVGGSLTVGIRREYGGPGREIV